eukprot:Blabericola_migrator_1__13450@NODE_968_length_5872_cov_146_680276_g670_i0_p2_GENE_NODE_968_length_5872_cov_146_680276_g670_i0NODE_968_length_5872_cov_146_680276_g670_i0_p2_ORF_typecomplete_len195_score35_28Inositol_P/PF00459_25/8_9e41FBPase/PF00316_20/0_0018_NODE_968_length_5872_cov_146_680276_g670_i0118702
MDLDLEALITLVRDAGKAILEVYINPTTWNVKSKADNSPLTLADTRANEIICARLGSLYPDIPIISEENKEEEYEIRKTWDWCWCVDPLDGTREFLKRNGQFTVNIGLIYKQEPYAGFVGVPWSDEIYFAQKGLGAHYRRYEKDQVVEETRHLKVAEVDWTKPGLRIVGSRSHATPLTEAFISQFKNPDIILMG